MKQKIILFVILIASTLTGCGHNVTWIVLPDIATINSIEISNEAGTAEIDTQEEIEQFLEQLGTAVKTSKQSVSDAPDVINTIDIDMFFDNGSSRCYIYRDGSHYYIEQPYVGIFRISGTVYQNVLGLIN